MKKINWTVVCGVLAPLIMFALVAAFFYGLWTNDKRSDYVNCVNSYSGKLTKEECDFLYGVSNGSR